MRRLYFLDSSTNMSDKRISIIIQTLNEEDNLTQLLPYLSEHKSIDTEIIVADAYSTRDQTNPHVKPMV